MLPGMDAQRFFSKLGQVLARGNHSLSGLNEFGEPWKVEFLGPPLKPTSHSARSR